MGTLSFSLDGGNKPVTERYIYSGYRDVLNPRIIKFDIDNSRVIAYSI